MKNLKIGTKLTISFGFVIFVAAALVFIALRNFRLINNDNTVLIEFEVQKMVALGELETEITYLRYKTLYLAFHAEEPLEFSYILTEAQETADNVISYFNVYLHLLDTNPNLNETIRNSLRDITNNMQLHINAFIFHAITDMHQAVILNERDEIHRVLDAINNTHANFLRYFQVVFDYALNEVEFLPDRISQRVRTVWLTLVIISIITLCVVVAMALYIYRSIANPLAYLSEVVNDVINGNFNFNRKQDVATDQTGHLTTSMYILADTIKSINENIVDFVHNFVTLGDYEYRMDTSKYDGGYKELTESIVKLAEAGEAEAWMQFNAMESINKGLFDLKVEELPGKRIITTNNVKALLSNIKNVIADINTMIEAAVVKGNLQVHVDETKYEGEWRTIVRGLNDIAYAVDAPIVEIRDVMNRLGQEGYLDKRIEGNYTGDFLDIKNAINSTMENLSGVVGNVAETLAKVSEGDLTVSIKQDYSGDFIPIKDSINRITVSLQKTMSEILASSDQVLSGAKQISSSALDLANGATEQATSVEELNASINMINQQTKQNEDNAQEANVLSHTSTQNATEGNESMIHMLDAMLKIKESSDGISKIIKVIQDIAFQTNLLALNAAVEAARAGEHGRGFAVVAEEVRNLAARSQQAAEETTGLIEDSINRVNMGSGIAQTTADALNIIVTNANEVSNIINGISVSSQEQAESVAQVSSGLEQISSVVQSNSAVSEEAAAAAQELNSQAELLRQLVSYFKLA